MRGFRRASSACTKCMRTLRGPDLALATTDYLSVVEGAANYGFTADELAALYIGTLPAGAPDSYIDHNGYPPKSWRHRL